MWRGGVARKQTAVVQRLDGKGRKLRRRADTELHAAIFTVRRMCYFKSNDADNDVRGTLQAFRCCALSAYT